MAPVKGASEFKRASGMPDCGAAFTLITKGSAEAHGLQIYSEPGSFQQADRNNLGVIIGYVDVYLQVSDKLVIKLDKVKVTPSEDYQVLIGCDILNGDGQWLGPSIIDMEGSITWRLLKDQTMHVSKLDVPVGTKLLQGAFASFERARKALQDKPASSTGKAAHDKAKPTAPSTPTAAAPPPPTLLEAKLSLPKEVVAKLHAKAEQRQTHLTEKVTMDEARKVIDEAREVIADCGLSPAAKHAVGQCLWRRTRFPNFSQKCAKVLKAAEEGDAAIEAVRAELGLPPMLN